MFILATDQAICSGWALIQALTAKPVRWGIAKGHDEIDQVVRFAVTMAGGPKLLYALTEDHGGVPLFVGGSRDRGRVRSGGKQRSTATILGMGAARGWWEHALCSAAIGGVARSHLLKVSHGTWKAEVLGARWAKARTEAVRAESVRFARALLGVDVTHDEAAAVCMAVWGAKNVPAKLVAAREARSRARKAV
jgi:hypothetical protein